MDEIRDVSAAHDIHMLEQQIVSDLEKVGELMNSWELHARSAGLSKEYVLARGKRAQEEIDMKRTVTQIMAARKNDVLLEIVTSLQTMAEGVLPVNPEQAEK